jgi:hypothetical protein
VLQLAYINDITFCGREYLGHRQWSVRLKSEDSGSSSCFLYTIGVQYSRYNAEGMSKHHEKAMGSGHNDSGLKQADALDSNREQAKRDEIKVQ